MKNVEKLNFRPFTRFCMSIGAVPTSYLAGLTIEEQLLWLCSYLEKEVIPAVNNNAECVTELQELFTELKNYVDNYFENLDVQEEINNKLDNMAEHGELENIIAAYLNTRAIFGFDTVSDMVSAENLDNGSYARTLGYNSINDNGNGLYKIRNVTNEDVVDGGSIIALDNEELVAVLITMDNIIKPEQFGTVGDGVTDDSTKFTNAFNYAINNNLKFKAEKTYKTSSTLNLTGQYHEIEINSIIYNGTSNFLNIKGEYNEIKINKLIGSTGISQGGIVFQSVYNNILNSHNKVEFQLIDGFNKAIYLDGETANSFGIQYNEIKGGLITSNNEYGIYLGLTSQTAVWINQNYFDKIRVNCKYGVYMNNNDQRNNMNSNIFNEIGIEPDSAVQMIYGIYTKNNRENYFINCRASELHDDETLIYEDNIVSSVPNTYEFTQIIPINKLHMTGGYLKSSLASNNYALTLSISGAKFYDDGSYLLLDNKWKNTGRIYNAYNANLDLTANDRKDVALDMVYRFGADSNGDYKFILNKANLDRTILKVYISNLPATYTIKVEDENANALINTGVINSNGMWTIEKESQNKWYAYK